MLYIGNLVSEYEPEERISCFLKFSLWLGNSPFWYAVSIALPTTYQASPQSPLSGREEKGMKDKGLFLLN